MVTYHLNEGAFELPDQGFLDRTVHHLEARLESGEELSLVVCRTRIPPGRTLREMVIEHGQSEAAMLAGYSILDEREGARAGVPAIEIAARFRREGTVRYQRLAHLAVGDAWLLFALTGPYAEREACDAHLTRLLDSLRLRD